MAERFLRASAANHCGAAILHELKSNIQVHPVIVSLQHVGGRIDTSCPSVPVGSE
jgi:hypothetical protein